MRFFVLALLACGSTGAPVPHLDEPAWLDELAARRPDLLTTPTGSVSDPAWQALVVRPRYRPELLGSERLTYAMIVAREYTEAQRVSDARWAQSLRDAQAAFPPGPAVAVAGYDPRAYVGYRVGPATRPVRSGPIVSYKAFFELTDFQASLSADRYAGFVDRLAALGFRGDSKIDLRPGQVRFQYNNLIVHAPSMEMARCAEAAGLEHFGRELAHTARGVDALVDGEPTNWHHFLLTGRYHELPAAVRDFVEYREPPPSLTACPQH